MEESEIDMAPRTTSLKTLQKDGTRGRAFFQNAASGYARQHNGDSHDNSVNITKNFNFFTITDPESIPFDQRAALYDAILMLSQAKWPRDRTRGKEIRIPDPIPSLSKKQILKKLMSSPQNTRATADNYSRIARSQGPQQNICNCLMDTYKFRDWFGSRAPRKLVVQPPCTTSKTSTGSFAAATLHPVFSRIQPSLTLTFFCGVEKSGSGGWELEKALMANLLYQMILASTDNCLKTWMTMADVEEHERCLKYRIMDYMCAFFEHLITESEYNVIFCLIDDVRCLEAEASADTTAIFALLDRLTACSNQETRTAFKLIMFTAYDKGPITASTERSDIVSVSERDLRTHSQPNLKQIARFLDQYAKS